MNDTMDMQSVLDVAIGKVDARKLEQLKRKLEDALGCPLASQQVDDPMIIRFRLVEQLRDEGVSPGMIQSFEQLFMGIIRRASVMNLIPAPPEGPWTRAWQSVIDEGSKVRKAKSPLRSFASWASAHGLTPLDIDMHYLKLWIEDLHINREAQIIVEHVLARWVPPASSAPLLSDALLTERLQKKALTGTVKHLSAPA
ncbi:MAG: hypothetical protein M3Z24_04340 [Chloroflexota bacterium]|nr:hypothetical protein [Chloroflexota bacterium]